MQLQNSSSKPSEQLTETPMSPVEAIQTWLVSKLAAQLSLAPNSINVREALTRYGLDSIDAVTLVGDLEDWLDVELPSTLFWDYPTIEKAAQYLVNECDVSAVVAQSSPALAEEKSDDQPEKAAKSGGWGGFWKSVSGN